VDTMTGMKAYRLTGWGAADLVDVPCPQPAVGEVLVRVAGVGLCRSDLHFMDAAPGGLRYAPPFTLGHEIAGWVEACGPGPRSGALAPGDAVVLYTIDFCGVCTFCMRGQQNYCLSAGSGRGFGTDGGLAPLVVARSDQVVALHRLEPRSAAPLTDAGMTAYHAVARVRRELPQGSVVAVIGIGGLGSFAVQFLRELTDATVVGLDTRPERASYACRLGADEATASVEDFTATVRKLTAGRGAEAVLDFVGTSETMHTAVSAAAAHGRVVVVGVGDGELVLRRGAVPFECDVVFTRAGTPGDLAAVVDLAENGRISVDAEYFSLDDVGVAYAALRTGRLTGRAVVVPTSES
jgi:propanol-preferring alcohol dehydrogenase